jgi:hypothetical protein
MQLAMVIHHSLFSPSALQVANRPARSQNPIMKSHPLKLGLLSLASAFLLTVASGAAQAQTFHSKNEGVAACSNATATANINGAITQKAGNGVIQQIAQQGHCFNLDPGVGFSVVKTVHVDGPDGGADQVIGQVTLQDGSRTRFYLNQSDIDPNPPTDPSVIPGSPAPADFGTSFFDPSKIPPPAQ